MTLRSRITAIAAPIVVAVAYDTFILGARIIGFYRLMQENPAMFNGAEAKEQFKRALTEHMLWQADEDEMAA